jgi:CheY-like chemotaxis protein
MPVPLIAVVDDDQPFIDLVCDVLDDEGYATLCLYRSVGAYQAIKTQQPAAIILDMQMETPDAGLDVLTLLRRDPETADIPVILCSARTDLLADHAERLHGLRCIILEKPFALDELVELVTTLAPVPS